MIEQLFPAQIDNAYSGPTAAIWLLAVIVIMKILMGLNVAGLNPWVSNKSVLMTADGIPLNTYGAEAAKTIVFLFSCWGLALLALNLFGAIVLIRYRAMIPLAYLLLAIEQLGRKGLALLHPLARVGDGGAVSSGAIVNWAFSAALVGGFFLSFWERQLD